jgi:uroporphyrinogen decarboxylase
MFPSLVRLTAICYSVDQRKTMELSPKERTLRAIHRQPLDFVPYDIACSPPVLRMLQRHLGCQDVAAAIGNHVLLVHCSTHPAWADPEVVGEFIEDDFGVVWRTSSYSRGYVVRHPLTQPSLRRYHLPDPRDPLRFKAARQQLERRPDLFRVAKIGDLFERACFLRGMDLLLSDFILNPHFLEELFDALAEYLIATVNLLAGWPVDALWLSDDYGHQQGLLMSPTHWRRFIKPRLAKIVEAAHRNAFLTLLHSDGAITEIIADLVDLGLDILHPLQPESVDIYAIKKQFGNHLTLYGGIGTQQLLRAGKPHEVRAEVQRAIKIVGEGGGYILAPGLTVQHDVPLENLLAFIEAAQKQ